MPYATASQAREYYAGEDAGGITLAVAMGIAARTVAAIAPPPATVTDDYEEAAAHAELLIGKHIWGTDGGTLSSAGASGKTVTFTKSQEARDMVASAMGGYVGSNKVRSLPLSRG